MTTPREKLEARIRVIEAEIAALKIKLRKDKSILNLNDTSKPEESGDGKVKGS